MCSGSVGVARKVNQFVWFIIFQVCEQVHPLDLLHDRWWYIWHNFHLLSCLGLILLGIISGHENSQVILVLEPSGYVKQLNYSLFFHLVKYFILTRNIAKPCISTIKQHHSYIFFVILHIISF